MEEEAVLKLKFNHTQIIIYLLAHFISFPFCFLVLVWFSSTEMQNIQIFIQEDILVYTSY